MKSTSIFNGDLVTPAMKSILAGLAEQRLAQVQKEAAELTQAIVELRSDAPATNGDIATSPANKSANLPTSQLEIRLEQLREQHGPVFVIDPKNPVAPGQRIKWGKPGSEKTIEVLETAELPGRDGAVVPARFFAKLVDV